MVQQLITESEVKITTRISAEMQKSRIEMDECFAKALQNSNAKVAAALEQIGSTSVELTDRVNLVNEETRQELRTEFENGRAEAETRTKSALEARCTAVEGQIKLATTELAAAIEQASAVSMKKTTSTLKKSEAAMAIKTKDLEKRYLGLQKKMEVIDTSVLDLGKRNCLLREEVHRLEHPDIKLEETRTSPVRKRFESGLPTRRKLPRDICELVEIP